MDLPTALGLLAIPSVITLGILGIKHLRESREFEKKYNRSEERSDALYEIQAAASSR